MDEGTLEQINSHINLPITKDERIVSLFSYNFFGRIYSLSQTMVYLKTVFPSGFYLNLNQGFSWQT
jgi:hypothetical protein